MFLDDDERLLPLQFRLHPANLDSLKRFREAGIKTMRLNSFASWHVIEATPGVFDFDEVDDAIELMREAGLKVAVHLYRRAPDWLPEEGKSEFVWTPGTSFLGPNPDRVFKGKSWLALNPFHADSLEMELEFLERACEHFSVPGAVECSYSMPYSAERVLPFCLTGKGAVGVQKRAVPCSQRAG